MRAIWSLFGSCAASGQTSSRLPTNVCETCVIKHRCTPSKQRRLKRWEHEAILERVQQRLDANPDMMPLRSKTVEHP